MDFRVGDLVRLRGKTSNPLMTIVRRSGSEWVCGWFDRLYHEVVVAGSALDFMFSQDRESREREMALRPLRDAQIDRLQEVADRLMHWVGQLEARENP